MSQNESMARMIEFPTASTVEGILEKIEALSDEECKQQYLYYLAKLHPDWRKLLTNLLLHGDTDWKRLSNRAVAALSDALVVLSTASENLLREIDEQEKPFLENSPEVQRMNYDFSSPGIKNR